jgi:hypothetical protein
MQFLRRVDVLQQLGVTIRRRAGSDLNDFAPGGYRAVGAHTVPAGAALPFELRLQTFQEADAENSTPPVFHLPFQPVSHPARLDIADRAKSLRVP